MTTPGNATHVGKTLPAGVELISVADDAASSRITEGRDAHT
jgi:hypothetical protein